MILSPVKDIKLLTEPIALGPLKLKNRMCMPAMHLNFTMGGEVSDELVAFYRRRAEGGVAMITVGGCAVDKVGSGPIMIGLHEDRFIPGLERLTGTIHEGGALAVAQLYQAGKYAYSMITGQQAVSASAIKSRLTGETPRALTLAEIDEIQQAFVDAARRAASAGFDGVEVLASAGYLIAQFLSPVSNRREDQYGGSFENRVRFGREVVERVRAAVGPGQAVLVRVAGADFVDGGHDNADSARASQVFAAAGADAINVTGGWHETRVPQLTMGVPRGAFMYLSRGIRDAVEVPVIASNRFSDPLQAEASLRSRIADLINFGRPLIADPDLPDKVAGGRIDEVVHCVACNQGCFDHIFAGMPIGCMVNPRVGREAAGEPRSQGRAARVLVVGGGPGGMMAAATAAGRGHDVTLMERGQSLGGQLLLAGSTRGRQELHTLVKDLMRRLERERVTVRLGVEVTPEIIAEHGPDHVILATGARPVAPLIEGAELPLVAQAWDVLAGEVDVGRRVVVIGGGAVAVDAALDLAKRGTLDAETLRFLLVTGAESGERLRELCLDGTHEVTVVEMARKIGKGIGKSTRWTLMQGLKKMNVSLLDNTEARRITPEGVVVRDAEDNETLVEADTVVMAVGARSDDTLAGALDPDLEKVVVGDARSARRAYDAIHEGYQAAMKI